MMKHVPVYALLMFVFYISGKGQNKTELPKDDIKFQTKEVITSIPSGMNRAIKQDRNGNIWITAYDGVYRYDGKSFTNVISEVSSARFFSVLEDKKGNFWFSSISAGVYYYDGKSFQNFTTQQGLASDRVTYSYEDKEGNIWFGTDGGGASRYDGRTFRNFTSDDGMTNNEITTIIEDKTGKFWFGTRGNTFVYDGKKFNSLIHDAKTFTNVRSIIEDRKGNIWLGGSDGLWRYDGSTFVNFTRDFVFYIYEDKKGNIWTSSQEGHNNTWAVSRYEENSLSNKRPTVTVIKSSRIPGGILEADDGSIWFGAEGVYRYDGNTMTHFKNKKDQ